MSEIRELLRHRKYDELWQICCGFLDLNLEQFMNIQRRLLLEQIELLKTCELGRKLMNGAMPRNISEFREQVPLSTYSDYCPDLLSKREDILPGKPALWVQTSGRSGEYPFKWVPVTEKFWQEAGLNFSAIAILASCKGKGDIAFRRGFRLLHAAAPPPFLTGNVARRLEQDLDFEFLPPVFESEKLTFEERVNKGFKSALNGGMDGFFGLAGVLVAIAEKFKQGSGKTKLSSLLMQPGMLLRLLRGLVKAKIAGRPMLPQDLWSLKVIVSMGTDSLIYKEKIKELWGRVPLDVYGNSETTVIATQTWDYNDKVFFPNLNFLEFIPEGERIRGKLEPGYKPQTLLLDEVKAGENYELVITNFHGGAMVRYRVGDIIQIKSLRNEKLGINLPQMAFERRADDLIDLGFMRLTERVIWQALENAGVPYRGWTARKEVAETPRLHLFVELANNFTGSSHGVARAVYDEINKLDDGLYVYKELDSLEKLINFKPIEVTLLHEGVFSSYRSQMQSEGADFVHQRPPHINPSDKVLSLLGHQDTKSNDKSMAGR